MSEPVPQTRNRSVFYGSLAVLIAGATALGTWRVMSGYQVALEAARRPLDTVEVLTSTRDLAVGDVIEEDDLVLVRVSRSETDVEAVFADRKAIVGESAVERILAGEPIRRERLTLGSGISRPERALEPGTRAVTVRVDRAAGVGGLVMPGSFVDVIVTIRPDANALGANWVTETIIQAVRVLAVGDTVVARGDEGKGKGTTGTAQGAASTTRPRDVYATLEVEPDEAEKLAMATSRGDLYLSLRPRDDFELSVAETPLITNALVGISAKPSPARANRLARMRVAATVEAPPPVVTHDSEVISGSKVTVERFEAGGARSASSGSGK